MNLQIIAPFTLRLSDDEAIVVDALFLNFGGRSGMLLITDYGLVKDHQDRISHLGYGFSTLSQPKDGDFDYDPEVIREVLADWTWTGDATQRPSWMPEANTDDHD